MFVAYRCRVCGETYLGKAKPENCPYCGAQKKYLKKMENYDRLMPEEVSDKSRENILEAIELEIDNAQFYDCAARNTEDESEAAIFKRLKKVEAEHAEALAELIDVEEKELSQIEECSEDALENYRDAHDREERAIKAYGQFASEAEEPEIEEFFNAIIEVEQDHLVLSDRKQKS